MTRLRYHSILKETSRVPLIVGISSVYLMARGTKLPVRPSLISIGFSLRGFTGGGSMFLGLF